MADGTQDTASSHNIFVYRTITLFGQPFQGCSTIVMIGNSTYAVLQPQRASTLVWAVPISLATTLGISFDFFSSRY